MCRSPLHGTELCRKPGWAGYPALHQCQHSIERQKAQLRKTLAEHCFSCFSEMSLIMKGVCPTPQAFLWARHEEECQCYMEICTITDFPLASTLFFSQALYRISLGRCKGRSRIQAHCSLANDSFQRHACSGRGGSRKSSSSPPAPPR